MTQRELAVAADLSLSAIKKIEQDTLGTLAAHWADRVEPRLPVATNAEISAWGWLLLRGSAAAIRDNRSDEAADMMRLAEAAAVAAGRERGGYRMYWTTFGPATVAMKRTENALVDGRPDVALRRNSRSCSPSVNPGYSNGWPAARGGP